MTRLIALPVGLSLLTNLQNRFRINLSFQQEATEILAHWNEISPHVQDLSAELSILSKLRVNNQDTVVFLATDTDSAEQAARANAFLAQKVFGLTPQIVRVKGLDLDNAEIFLKQGLHNLFTELDKCVSRAHEKGLDPVLGVAGGIKAPLPYVAIYGMLTNVPLVYVFEKTQALVTLPPLPIDFDWDGLRNIESILQRLHQEGAIPLSHLRSALGPDFSKWEGLFEQEEGYATLSAFGELLLSKVRRAQELPVMLSPSATEKLQSLIGSERDAIEILLDRVRNPFWRAQKCHSFSGTDLLVIKPGATSPRLAICQIKNEVVYIAEIYSTHDEYEQDLSKRRCAQYDPKTFTAYYPQPKTIAPEIEEKTRGDISLALALSQIEHMKKELGAVRKEKAEALDLAINYEQKLKDYEARLQEQEKSIEAIQEKLFVMEAQEKELSSWGLWRRLRWALFRS